jgi:amidase
MAKHRFVPQSYHRTLGSHEAVMSVASGDAIHTTTVDARGYDAAGVQVTEPGNPQTGPFFVEGAAFGDTLAVRFDRLVPSRKTGWTGSSVAANVLDPDYVAKERPGSETTEWTIDLAGGTARLSSAPPRLAALALKLAPMVGCFGVAPSNDQAISTATSGPHGGNMDYRGFVQGVTAYFPVFAEGALFHIGDGHAVQGDGEIVGTGIETSFEVEFTLRLIKGRKILWPRGENTTHIFTVGNARPLDQATQHATTEMVRWLNELGLEGTEGHLLLGQCVEYEIGNMFDPAYTVVCKIARSVLRQIGLAADSALR